MENRHGGVPYTDRVCVCALGLDVDERERLLHSDDGSDKKM